MKTHTCCALGFLLPLLLLVGIASAAPMDTNPSPLLTIELRDGSRVIGTLVGKNFRFHSALLGDLKLGASAIRLVECVSSNSAKLTTVNGDTLTVSLADSTFAVKTSFGNVALAADSIRKLTVSAVSKSGLHREGLVSWWREEGDASDSAGANNGVVVGHVEFVPGKVGLGFGLNGNGYIRVPASPSLNMSNELTIELWYKLLDTTVTFGHGLVNKRNNEHGPINYGSEVNANQNLTVYFNDPAVSDGDHCCYESSDYSPAPPAGAFHHFTTTFQQETNSVVAQTFLDGQLVRTRTFAGASLARAVCTAPVTIGVEAEYPDYLYFKGIIDEVRLYNRALSDSEIREDFEVENTD